MNDFGCRHSDKLQSFFEIEARGIDYINDFGTCFEFKESFAKDFKQLFFKVPKAQLQNADFIVFCVHNKEFYLHSAKQLLVDYNFNNKSKHCCLRYSRIVKDTIFETDSLHVLKGYIDNRRLV